MSTAEKLLEKMRQTKQGWGYNDLERLYEGFGFESRQGGSHAFFSHPKHRDLAATVARHRSLAGGYVQHAIKLIDELKKREGNYEDPTRIS